MKKLALLFALMTISVSAVENKAKTGTAKIDEENIQELRIKKSAPGRRNETQNVDIEKNSPQKTIKKIREP